MILCHIMSCFIMLYYTISYCIILNRHLSCELRIRDRPRGYSCFGECLWPNTPSGLGPFGGQGLGFLVGTIWHDDFDVYPLNINTIMKPLE